MQSASKLPNLVVSALGARAEPLIKAPGFISKVMAPLTRGTGLFGNLEKDLSKHTGRNVHLFSPDDLSTGYPAELGSPAVNKFQNFISSGPTDVVNLGTSIKDFLNTRVRRQIGQPGTAGSASGWNDKAYEANALQGILPRSRKLSDIIKDTGVDFRKPDAANTLRTGLQSEFGKDWLLKPRLSYKTMPSALPTNKTEPEQLLAALKGGITNSDGELFGRGAKSWLAQPRLDLQQQSRGDVILDTIAKKIFGKSFGTGNKEYRVHSIGNEVIPGASVYRGGVRAIIPWQTKEQKMIEQQMGELLRNNLSPKHKNMPFAFDVALDRAGKVVPIEANPAIARDGASGLAQLPHVLDAVASHYSGKTPMFIQRQNNIIGAAKGLGVGIPSAAVGSALTPSLARPPDYNSGMGV